MYLKHLILNFLDKLPTTNGLTSGFAPLSSGEEGFYKGDLGALTQVSQISHLYNTQILASTDKVSFCAVLEWLRNFYLSSSAVPDGKFSNDAHLDSVIRYQPV